MPSTPTTPTSPTSGYDRERQRVYLPIGNKLLAETKFYLGMGGSEMKSKSKATSPQIPTSPKLRRKKASSADKRRESDPAAVEDYDDYDADAEIGESSRTIPEEPEPEPEPYPEDETREDQDEGYFNYNPNPAEAGDPYDDEDDHDHEHYVDNEGNPLVHPEEPTTPVPMSPTSPRQRQRRRIRPPGLPLGSYRDSRAYSQSHSKSPESKRKSTSASASGPPSPEMRVKSPPSSPRPKPTRFVRVTRDGERRWYVE